MSSLIVTLSCTFCFAQSVFVGAFESSDGINGAAITKTITDELKKLGITIEPIEAKADVVVSGRAFRTADKTTIVAKIDGKKSKKILAETLDGAKADPIEKTASSLASKIEQTIKAQLKD